MQAPLGKTGTPGPTTRTNLEGDAGADEVISAYIAEVLVEERARKASLEARGVALVTASGAFATFILAIATFGGGNSHLPGLARVLLALSTVGFLASAACGAWLNKPADYREPAANSLSEIVDKGWERNVHAVRKAVADNIVDVLATARTANASKAYWLIVGTAVHVVAIIGVALASVAVLSLT